MCKSDITGDIEAAREAGKPIVERTTSDKTGVIDFLYSPA
jgi:hypothetical protein